MQRSSPSPPAGAPANSGTTPAPASASGLSSPLQQCLTPPSVRRREARVARCAYVAAAHAQARRVEAQANDEGAGAEPEPEPRLGYAAAEVEARRAGRRQAAWQGWEAEAAAYRGPLLGSGDGDGDETTVVRPDGTVDWETLAMAVDSEELANAPVIDAPLALGYFPRQPGPAAVRRSMETPVTLPARPSVLTLPSLPSTIAGSYVSNDMLPLILGALYVAARAVGLGGRRPADATLSGASAKTRRSRE